MQLVGVHDGLSAFIATERARWRGDPFRIKPRNGRMYYISARHGGRDGTAVWTGYFAQKNDALIFWRWLESGKSLPYNISRLPTPAWEPALDLDTGLSYYWFNTQAVTSTSASVQSFSVPTTWNSTGSKVETIAAGGAGSTRQSTTIGGTGGGAAEYTVRNNVSLVPGGSASYLLPAGGVAAAANPADCWFNDVNLISNTSNLSDASWNDSHNSSVTANATADPTGAINASKIVATVAGGASIAHDIGTEQTKPAAAHTMVMSAYVKVAEKSRIMLYFLDGGTGNGSYATLDVAGAQIGVAAAADTGWTTGTAAITTDNIATGNLGNGWYLVSYSATTPATTSDIFVLYRLDNNTGTGVSTQSFVGDGSAGIYIYGPSLHYGSTVRPYTANASGAALFSNYAKSGTSGTTSAAGVHQTGGQGDTVREGGDGFKPGTGVAIGGGGGGAGGPSGAGSTSTTSAGGAADNSVVSGGAQGANGNAGTEFGTQGSGSGAGGRSGNGGGFTGGSFGGGGSGTGTQSGQTGGSGAPGIIFLTWTPRLVNYALQRNQSITKSYCW